VGTDIAFCVGVLTVLGRRVPRGLVVFITALAIFDDIGGILVIAVFYGDGLHLTWLLAAAALVVVVFDVTSGLVYALALVALWYLLHHAGIHATIAGVVLGLLIPARARRPSREVLHELATHAAGLHGRKAADEELDAAEILMIQGKLEDLQAPVQRFVHLLHPLVAFGIMPVFALANAGVALSAAGLATLANPVAAGVGLGLLLGKPIGIFGLTVLAVRLGLAPMPGGAGRVKLLGVSVIAGIGFTVALFIASLAYPGAPEMLDEAKMGILGRLAGGRSGRMGPPAPHARRAW
jgi:NhaA family Na+:H+ antiporter